MHTILLRLATIYLCMAPQADYTLESVDLVGHEDRSNYVAFSPDGTLLASGSRDGSVGSGTSPIAQHEDVVDGVVFSHDGTMLASTGLKPSSGSGTSPRASRDLHLTREPD
ncbi:WD40 repeat domain-containing protein [Paludisphaera borealis]|uniref:Uncharacterized protein n=1 Tax=Paludisphaera borealis TaxID=1387353 RepID=A0A1U7CJC5_9BACT|nr:hypothetical protein [Paludisphaera borealis]APW59008.1 hypothetical protein BSF38_00421 [Paludisphaera borealis]